MKSRKWLSISVVIALIGGAAAAAGNLMAPAPKNVAVDKATDGGTSTDTSVPLQKKEAKKEATKKDPSKQ